MVDTISGVAKTIVSIQSEGARTVWIGYNSNRTKQHFFHLYAMYVSQQTKKPEPHQNYKFFRGNAEKEDTFWQEVV
jgi:hypothetical protein